MNQAVEDSSHTHALQCVIVFSVSGLLLYNLRDICLRDI